MSTPATLTAIQSSLTGAGGAAGGADAPATVVLTVSMASIPGQVVPQTGKGLVLDWR
jgi:hypothetical protein